MTRTRALSLAASLLLLLPASGAWPVVAAGAASGQQVRHAAGRKVSRKRKAGVSKKMNSKQEGESRRVAEGVWGGTHIRLAVSEDGASVVYDCARGTLDGPLVLDASGRFSVAGTHVREHPGPVRLRFQPPPLPARYAGAVEGETMTLTVTLTDKSEEFGVFKLTRGSEGHVRKCR